MFKSDSKFGYFLHIKMYAFFLHSVFLGVGVGWPLIDSKKLILFYGRGKNLKIKY